MGAPGREAEDTHPTRRLLPSGRNTKWLRDLQRTLEDVQNVVKSSDKQRFDIKTENGDHLIRAVQGHSIKAVQDDSLLRRLHVDDSDFPAVCVHGTYRRHFE